MVGDKTKNRIEFLAETFDVFECDSYELKEKQLLALGYETKKIVDDHSNNIICILSTKKNSKDRVLKKVSICDTIFTDMIKSDPTDNKIYLQWMLNTFVRLIKSDKLNDVNMGMRFISEDLPLANDYLILFEENKRKNKFKDLCKNSYSLIGITDPTNINQYKNLSQLFDAVDPFIKRDPSSLERTMLKFVNSGKALIPVKDRHYTLYIPKCVEASVIFNEYANWCTAKPGNGMFRSYTENNRKPNGDKSDIYIIIDNSFFEGKTNELFQIHFETNQLKDRTNSTNVNIFEKVLDKSEGVSNFFHDELSKMAKDYNKGLENNIYVEYLVKFGFAETLFELLDDDTPAIKFMNKEIPKLSDLSKFVKLDQLIITESKLIEVHPSIGSLNNLKMLVLSKNKIKTLPKEIGNLKNLIFLNITGNPIFEIPSEIKYLDKSNGGSLERLGVSIDEIGEENYNKLKELLPTTRIS
jgi:hypothetical protein